MNERMKKFSVPQQTNTCSGLGSNEAQSICELTRPSDQNDKVNFIRLR